MRYLSTAICLAMSVLVVGTTWAEDEAPNNGDRRAEMRKKIMAEFDADGDGELSDDERAKAREEMRSRRGDRAGRGQDGRGQGDRVNGERGQRPRAEGRRGGQGDPPEPGKLFDRFDADGNGSLSLAEFTKLSEEMRPPRPPRGGEGAGSGDAPPREGPRQGRRPRADRAASSTGEAGPPPRPEGRRRLKDDDEEGSASREPRERGQRGPGAGGPEGNRPPNPEAAFQRFDENNDKQLSRDEFMKLADRMRQMQEGRGGRGGPGARGGRGGGRGGAEGEQGGNRPRRPARPQFDDDSV